MPTNLNIPQALNDSEISFTISSLRDDGFDVALGITSQFDASTKVKTFDQTCIWPRDAAIRHYPESSFAKKFGPAGEVIEMPAPP